jgi:hypothetical protein
VGFQVLILSRIDYAVTIVPQAGVTVVTEGGRYTLSGNGAMLTLIKIATDVWALSGNLVV